MRSDTYAAPAYGLLADGMAGVARPRVRAVRPNPKAVCHPFAAWSPIALLTSAGHQTGRPRRIGESP